MKKVLFVCIAALLASHGITAASAGPLAFDKSEYAARRARLMAKIPDGIAVFWGSLSAPQNNELIYLCGVKVPRAVLIIDGVRKESLLFYTATENYLKGEGMSVDLARDPKAAT
jgi:Xaa-Pro aminopeptidase